mmetsp:Transcript_26834/g.70457  ORF Transcript_26834/g.70457 Transcript_26834/m.70457 type:complete len:177 (-) Transcript_26834:112-642(-)|eukprot:CAMPEP_0182927182 /NCGR_PEP_ID=MMETSP0105_2-20130417/13429_1 /TAXON_ID=81532 ORGANISM="Acanthoeca-like sp., Strain 10tr" /NCGR_SAMPLE_ID=MMETSP0105_2 /ASSEMBLY_ACC=CAM_ASM_000205 /LENGTH=176 /DNA_ID=CAMNT_0025065113 /DNA_START=76 /DNA_END=606 /DNA_ORIENTATION=-
MADDSVKRKRIDESDEVPFKPKGYYTITPYITIKNAASALDLYAKAFGATEVMSMPGPGGKIMHAEMQIGDSRFMFSDEFPEMGAWSPEHLGGTAGHLMIYVEDCDAMLKRAIAAGCKPDRPAKDQFYGDRSGSVIDPYGHKWTLSTHVKEVSAEECHRIMKEMEKEEKDGGKADA